MLVMAVDVYRKRNEGLIPDHRDDYIDGYYNKAIAAYKYRNSKEAIEYLLAVIDRQPYYKDAANLLGDAVRMQNARYGIARMSSAPSPDLDTAKAKTPTKKSTRNGTQTKISSQVALANRIIIVFLIVAFTYLLLLIGSRYGYINLLIFIAKFTGGAFLFLLLIPGSRLFCLLLGAFSPFW